MNTRNIALGFRTSTPQRLVGLVEIITGKREAKITMLDEGKTFVGGANTLRVGLEELPLKLKPDNREPTKFRIRMSPDGTEVESLGPVDGLYALEFIELGPRPDKDGPPMPEEKVWNEGSKDENRHWEFWASYKIISGRFKGVITPAYRLHYKFEQDTEGMTMFNFNPENRKATRGQQLLEWGKLHGNIWGEPIVWNDETILDVLEERILDGGHLKVQGFFKNGYISELIALDVEEDEDDELPDFLEEPDEEEESVVPVAKQKAKEFVKTVVGKNGNGKASKQVVAPSKSKTKRVKVIEDEDDDL